MITLGNSANMHDIKLGTTLVNAVYVGEDKVWPNDLIKPKILIYQGSGNIMLSNRSEYFSSIETEDGPIDLSTSGPVYYDFQTSGIHEVKITFKSGIEYIQSCFKGCTNLISIPGNLFEDNPEIKSFLECFYKTSLTSIPDLLFSNNTNVTNFAFCFSRTNITSIPKNLFKNNKKVTTFYFCFSNCVQLTSIPDDLFTNNTEVITFAGCFGYCTNLLFVPDTLFANNTKVIDFTACFEDCTNLTNIPIDNDGTYIYNRSTPGKAGYTIVTRSTQCFRGCNNIVGYSNIPSTWK